MKEEKNGSVYINNVEFEKLQMDMFTGENTVVLAKKEKQFNSSGSYIILDNNIDTDVKEDIVLTNINFQKGPVKEVGLNGCFIPDLLQIVINELQQFQNSDYRCTENTLAIKHLYQAVGFLRKRTEGRRERGVLGTYEK